MSIKDVFEKKSKKILKSSSPEKLGKEVESHRYISEYVKDKGRFVPRVDFEDPAKFAKFGSAEKYFVDSIERIHKSYPYDGSLYEKTAWLNSSSYFDLHIFEKKYPRTNGYALFSPGTPEDHAAVGNKGETLHNRTYKYGIPTTKEYISFQGGPHKDREIADIKDIFPNIESRTTGSRGANIYDLSKNRESNLKIGGIDGNTIEFWLKKDAWTYNASANAQNEVLFDLYNVNSVTASQALSLIHI